MQRKPLTTTHPHGYVLVRDDRRLGLLRISKNASTESKKRLDCREWIAFDDFRGPCVAFVREPYRRFISSIPESVLRVTERQVAEEDRGDRVVIPEDIFRELMQVADADMTTFLHLLLECVEYDFFDAHHEPQVNFLADRRMQLRIDPRLYPTEEFARSIAQIEEWTGISAKPASQPSNKGGAKPTRGRTPVIDLARRISGTGAYRWVRHSGLLGQRYLGSPRPVRIGELNALANRFTEELKATKLDDDFRRRVASLYEMDAAIWQEVTAWGGDVAASEIWPG